MITMIRNMKITLIGTLYGDVTCYELDDDKC